MDKYIIAYLTLLACIPCMLHGMIDQTLRQFDSDLRMIQPRIAQGLPPALALANQETWGPWITFWYQALGNPESPYVLQKQAAQKIWSDIQKHLSDEFNKKSIITKEYWDQKRTEITKQIMEEKFEQFKNGPHIKDVLAFKKAIDDALENIILKDISDIIRANIKPQGRTCIVTNNAPEKFAPCIKDLYDKMGDAKNDFKFEKINLPTLLNTIETKRYIDPLKDFFARNGYDKMKAICANSIISSQPSTSTQNFSELIRSKQSVNDLLPIIGTHSANVIKEIQTAPIDGKRKTENSFKSILEQAEAISKKIGELIEKEKNNFMQALRHEQSLSTALADEIRKAYSQQPLGTQEQEEILETSLPENLKSDSSIQKVLSNRKALALAFKAAVLKELGEPLQIGTELKDPNLFNPFFYSTKLNKPQIFALKKNTPLSEGLFEPLQKFISETSTKTWEDRQIKALKKDVPAPEKPEEALPQGKRKTLAQSAIKTITGNLKAFKGERKANYIDSLKKEYPTDELKKEFPTLFDDED